MTSPYFLFLLLSFPACIAGCQQKRPSRPAPPADSAVYYPFAPIYSNEFENGRPAYARMVLSVWRQYENGRVQVEKNSFADSVRLILPDRIMEGGRDSVLKLYQERRNGYSDMQCFIYSWLPVHFADEQADVVYVWGLYDGTRLNGDRDYAQVHEVWKFDSTGRIREMEQFRTHPH